MIGCYYHP